MPSSSIGKLKWAAVAVALLLSACADGQAVRLARSGQTVQCGPYAGVSTGPFATNLGVFGDRKLQACIDDYEAQGYKPIDPVPPPPADSAR